MNSPVMANAVPVQYKLLPFHGSANGISCTNEAYPVPQTQQFQPLTFKNSAVRIRNTARCGT